MATVRGHTFLCSLVGQLLNCNVMMILSSPSMYTISRRWWTNPGTLNSFQPKRTKCFFWAVACAGSESVRPGNLLRNGLLFHVHESHRSHITQSLLISPTMVGLHWLFASVAPGFARVHWHPNLTGLWTTVASIWGPKQKSLANSPVDLSEHTTLALICTLVVKTQKISN